MNILNFIYSFDTINQKSIPYMKITFLYYITCPYIEELKK